MSFPPTGDNGFASIAELLSALPGFAIPHFQRGQVWRDDSIARLFESLMLDTPCGSIILWAPDQPIMEVGEPVPQWGTDEPRFLVVDGQQRLTALSLALGLDSSWAMNLAAFQEFRSLADQPPGTRQRRRGPFTQIPEPPGADASAQRMGKHESDTRDLVPLVEILELGAFAWPYAHPANEHWQRLATGVQQIPSRQLQVVIKRDTELPEIVSLYNRINSSGVAVRPEERAFASMVSFQPNAASWLRDSFTATHAPLANDQPERAGRNTFLKREREKRFGFPLFIKTFAQTASHHLDRDGADLSMLTTLIWDEEWMEAESERQQIFDESARVLASTARVLREDLCCDDYRFLPAAEPLRPLFALQLKYPQVEERVIAGALLRLQVDSSAMSQRESDAGILNQIRRSNHLQEALDAFPKLGSQAGLRRSLTNAQSMQDSWVLLMYWYQRSLGAGDYGGQLTQLTVASKAHKEHIVPFSLLHPAFDDLDASGHSRTHQANAIGNLTFLSEEYNFEHGAEPVDLDSVPEELLRPHHLNDRQTLDAYRDAITALSSSDYEHGRRAYEKFRRLRTEQLATGMYEWLSDWEATESGNQQAEPKPQLIRPSRADLVRARNWPTAFQDAALAVAKNVSSTSKKNWVLWRTGTGKERTRIPHQVRLDSSGTRLMVGCQLQQYPQIFERLQGLVEVHQADLPWQMVYELDPNEASTVKALQVLIDLQPREA